MDRNVASGQKHYGRLAFWVSSLVAFGVYVCSLGSGISWGVENTRVVAACSWGIAAPPGYPVWSFLGSCFASLFGWVSWEGLANPAWGVAFLSAVCGAISVGIVARLVWEVLSDCCWRQEDAAWVGGWLCLVSGAVGLWFAFSPLMWECSVRADVEAWEMLLFVGMLAWSYRFLKHPRAKVLGVLFFLFGLALTNGLQLLWLGVPLWGMVFVAHRPLAKALLALFIPMGLTIHLLSIGGLPSAYEGTLLDGVAVARPVAEIMHGVLPLSFLPMVYYIGIGVLLILGVGSLVIWPRLKGSPRRLYRVTRQWWLGILVCGVAFLGLLVVAVERSEVVISPFFKGSLYGFGLTWGIHLLALGVLWVMCWRFHRSRRYALAISFVQIGLLLLYQNGFMVGLSHPRLWWFWWPWLWLGGVLVLGWRWLLAARGAVRCVGGLLAGLAFYLYVPFVNALSGSPEQWGSPFSWVGFHRLFAVGLGGGLPTMETWARVLDKVSLWKDLSPWAVGLWVVGMACLGFVGSGRYRVRWLLFLWAWAICCCLSFLLLPEGANVDLLQLQLRLEVMVLFGLGGLFGVGVIRLLRRLEGPALAWSGVLLGTGLVLFTGWLVIMVAMSGATVRGHAEALRWGSALLEGAPCISAWLTEDDEPLPDPFWPPPVEDEALVLTSTYVPYYLTHIMNVRKDVIVLTPNQWADELALAVRQRRYANMGVWLPEKSDIEARALQVNFKAHEALTQTLTTDEEKIDALLLRDVLEANATRAIYFDVGSPYRIFNRRLEPAGMGLKVALTAPRTGAVGIRDVDFWDWVSRALQHRSAYTHDVLLRRLFTARQLALADVYRQQGFLHWSYCSLVQAMTAYPIDATIRYVEIFLLRAMALEGTQMPVSNFENALWMLQAAEENDPENKVLQQLLSTIKKQKKALECCKSLQLSLNKGTISINERCLYIDACVQLEAIDEAREVAFGFTERFIPPAMFMEVLRRVMRLDAPEILYAVAVKMPTEMYTHLTEKELLEIVKVALDYQHRPLAQSLLSTGENRFYTSASWHWLKARYYYLYDDVALAYQHLQKARQYAFAWNDEWTEEDIRLAQAIEAAYQRSQEKGTRL